MIKKLRLKTGDFLNSCYQVTKQSWPKFYMPNIFLQSKVMLSKNQQASFVTITMAPALRQSVKNLLLHCVRFFYKINSSGRPYSIYRPEPMSDWKHNVYR